MPQQQLQQQQNIEYYDTSVVVVPIRFVVFFVHIFEWKGYETEAIIKSHRRVERAWGKSKRKKNRER